LFITSQKRASERQYMTGKTACISLLAAFIGALSLAACGTKAIPVWSPEGQATQAAMASTSNYETRIAPSPTGTILPTHTPTPVPPTATPQPTDTAAAATEVPTAIASATMDMGASASYVDPLSVGDPGNGQVLFNTFQPQASFACSTCHHPDSEERLIGPGLLNVSLHGLTHCPDKNYPDIVTYLHTSIVNPNDCVVEGYPENLMPQTWAQIYNDQQINDIIAYLLTLHS
jgi:mono/diheme cytochrome c family protein